MIGTLWILIAAHAWLGRPSHFRAIGCLIIGGR